MKPTERHRSLVAATAALALAAVMITACSFTSREAHFYLLTPTIAAAAQDHSTASSAGRSIGLGPVRLPAYLDRPQIVSVSGGSAVRLHDDHRWAAPLASELPQVLAENLAALLENDRVLVPPWPAGTAPDLQVSVEIIRFHALAGDVSAFLWARWTVSAAEGDASRPRSGSIRLSQPAPSLSIAGTVSAQSLLLAELSRRIAADLKAMAR